MTEPEIETLESRVSGLSLPLTTEEEIDNETIEEEVDIETIDEEIELEIPIGIDIGTWPRCMAGWNTFYSIVDVFNATAKEHFMDLYETYRDDISSTRVITAREVSLSQDRECHMLFEATWNKMRRLIGRTDTDPVVVHENQNFPFVLHTLGNSVLPSIFGTEDKGLAHTPAEKVLGEYLYHIRVMAETKLGRPIRNVVLAVPVSFSRYQLARMDWVCGNAGLHVIRMMPQPTAVAFLYAQQQLQKHLRSYAARKDMDVETKKIALIFNMDPGYCDVAVTAVTNKGECQMKALAGSPIGEADLVANMVRHLVPDYENIDEDKVHKKMGYLRVGLLEAIHRLSTQTSVEFDLDLRDGLKIRKVITREEFEEVNKEVFKMCERLIIQCLQDAEIKFENLDDVIIVGACYNMPRVKNLVCKICKGKCMKCSGKELYKDEGMKPLEAVVRGAAVAGALTSGIDHPYLRLFTSQSHITPLSVGIRANGNNFVPIISRNTLVPTMGRIDFTTIHDDQTEALILVYEGDAEKANENQLLGHLKIMGIPAAPKGDPQINVTMYIDEIGLRDELRVLVGVYMPGSEKPVIPAMEARLPTVEFYGEQGWLAEDLIRTYGDTMDLVTK